ncbi:diguanylate cyclase [Halovibrio salipaludis]|uniref:Diguanylate cyclase n=1 Tax=Halovibrio salipaludis TaxID=2032626 RepID=A0A2A2F868_9GAMM|nr:diguanylate cyclase [Halovibrio salipaludis]PAU81108.1 diguanylate cyclase [Halovibrio salipaludis]
MDTRESLDTKDALQQLQDLKATVDSIGSFIFMKDRHGRYTYANQRVQALFGLPMHAILGQDDSAFFCLDASRDLSENDTQVLVHGRTVEKEERNVIAGTGEERWYWSVKQPLFNADGSIRGMTGVSTDITEKVQLERALREKQKLLETALDHSPACIYVKDPERRYVYLNQHTASLYGQKAETIIGNRDEDILPSADADSCRRLDERVIATHQPQSDEEEIAGQNGTLRIYETQKVPLFSEDGTFTGFIGFSRDMTENRRLHQKLDQMAHEDQLTGLPNRRRTEQILEEEINRAHRSGQPLSLLALDLDHFKWVNDQHGHDVGDQVLLQVGIALNERLRSTDSIGRWGGEEFFVILPETASEGARQVAETLRQTTESCVLIGGMPVTVSIGVTEYDGMEGLRALISRADTILYNAKHSGRNQVSLISSQAALR